MQSLTPVFKAARKASRSLAAKSAADIDAMLNVMADTAVKAIPEILEANARDMARMAPDDPKRDRLLDH